MNRCPYCGGGHRNHVGENCPHCGAPVEAKPVQPQRPAMVTNADLDLLIQVLDDVLNGPRRLEYPA